MVVLIWKWLYFYSPPPHNNLELFFDKLTISLSKANEYYENFIVMGDFNIDFTNKGTEFDKSCSTSNHLEVPWWHSQIFLKLCDCDPCPMKRKSWKYELLTIYHFQDLAIQRSNLFPKIDQYNFFCFWYPFQSPIHSNSVIYSCFFWGDSRPSLFQKNTKKKNFFFWKWLRFWTLKKNLKF